MQENIGLTYEIISCIAGIIIGLMCIIFRKRFLRLQKNYFSKQKDYMNQKILEGIETRSDKNSYVLIVVVGSILIIGGIIKLLMIIKS